MPSGVVFVAILMIWAVILAPRVMRLYERSATQRTTSRFSSAMTVLGSGKAVARVAVDTARRGSRVVVDTRTPGVAPTPAPVPAGISAASRLQNSRAVQRRRRVALVCAAVLMVAVVAAVVGVLPWIAVPVAILPLVMFLGACVATGGHRHRSAASAAMSRATSTPVARASTSSGAIISATGVAPGSEPEIADSKVAALPTRRARRTGLRAGSWTKARILEADLAIAATYASAEEHLGMDRFVASPSDVDGQPYLRAANE